jgi:multidrug efflux pump subunit AcrB
MISQFFIERPIFANVIAFVTVIIGVVCLRALPVAQYPQIVPPTIQVSTRYPGASAEVVAATIGVPIEQAVNGVEGSTYMSSTSSSDGSYALTVTFEIGTDLNKVPGAGAKSGQQRRRPTACGRGGAGRHGPKGLAQHPAGHQPVFRGQPL